MGKAFALGTVLLMAIGVGVGLVMSSSKPAPTGDKATDDPFDADRAFKHLQTICDLGPRLTASDAMRRQQQLLAKHFEKLGATVELQEFEGSQPSLGTKKFPCANLIVRWHPDSKRRVLLGAHYDTRPNADEEPPGRGKQGVFLGANDGASGVALLMELGRQIPKLDLAVGVDFVCFDAEEYIFDRDVDKYFLGSEHFAKTYKKGPKSYRYDAVVVVDMVGSVDLQLHPDERSAAKAGALVREVWNVARELEIGEFRRQVKYDIIDDHISFQAIGVPAIVLIDFGYPHWHRLSDTPEQCSGKSLQKVSRVLVEWLKRRK